MQRIVLLNQFFHPDSAATAQLLTDVAVEFAELDGVTVTVLAAGSSYASAACASSGAESVGSSELLQGMKVIRTAGAGFSRGRVSRVLSYLGYLWGALIEGRRIPAPDVVMTLTTPPLLGLMGMWIKRDARHLIWEMDVYPDVACALDYLRPNRLLSWLLDLPRHRATGIIALGECMRERLLGHGIDPSKIHVIENWADGEQIRPLPMPSPDGDLRILYSGNMGLAHDYQTLLDVIPATRRVQFTFAGGGAHQAKFGGLPNTMLRPYSSLEALGQHLGDCHIGLVTQVPATLGCVVPSKSYGLMAAGRPILFIGPRQSTVARNIEKFKCGWNFECGDSAGVVALLSHLQVHREEIEEAGRNARVAFEANFDRPIAMAKFAKVLGLERLGAADEAVRGAGSVAAV